MDDQMGIAIKLKQYLQDAGIEYKLTEHKMTSSSESTASASHISSDSLAKAVVVKRDKGYLLVVVPASRDVQMTRLGEWLKQPVELAQEEEIAALFPDCELGAVPAVGAAYGLKTAVDESLDMQPDVYFEAGDHRTLVHLSQAQFRQLTAKVPHERFSTQARTNPG